MPRQMDRLVYGDGRLTEKAEKPANGRPLKEGRVADKLLWIPTRKFLNQALGQSNPFRHAHLLA